MRLFLDNLIAIGGSARVYRAHTTHTTRERVFVVKKMHTTKLVRNPVLRHEACVLISLRGHQSIPKVYAWGRTQYFEYMVIEELGPTISTTLSNSSGLTLRNLVALTCQMIDAVEHIHAQHLVHCDIKDTNVLFERYPSGVIKLIDFGLARYYRDPATLHHRPQTSVHQFLGTKSFASINMHYHTRPSRRDDIESLAYMILRLLCGGLPWINDEVLVTDILHEKAKWTGALLGRGWPPVFGAFLDYARKLPFEAKPEYNKWRLQFKAVSTIGEPPLYNSSDNGPRVGKAFWPPSMHPVTVRDPSQSLYDDGVTGDDDFFLPTSSWPDPVNVRKEDLIGDEQGTVSRYLEPIDEVPGMSDSGLSEGTEHIVPY